MATGCISLDDNIELLPPGMATLEATALHLHTTPQRLTELLVHTSLDRIERVPLGRGLGTYRLVPQLGIALLRQCLSPQPWHLEAWNAALADLLAAPAWSAALQALAAYASYLAAHSASSDASSGTWRPRVPRTGKGTSMVERFLLAPDLADPTAHLLSASFDALHQHGLEGMVRIEPMWVDRLEDDEDAVVLVGRDHPEYHAYLLARPLLRAVGLDYEKARGVIIATRTGNGIQIDVWPALGNAHVADIDRSTVQPDPELLTHLVDVSAPESAVPRQRR